MDVKTNTPIAAPGRGCILSHKAPKLFASISDFLRTFYARRSSTIYLTYISETATFSGGRRRCHKTSLFEYFRLHLAHFAPENALFMEICHGNSSSD